MSLSRSLLANVCVYLCVCERERQRQRERLIFIKTVCETLAAPPKPQIINLVLGPPHSIIIIAIRNNYYLPCWVGSLESAWDWGFSQEQKHTQRPRFTHKCFNMFGRHPLLGSLRWISDTLSFKLSEKFIRYKTSVNESLHSKSFFEWMLEFLGFLSLEISFLFMPLSSLN